MFHRLRPLASVFFLLIGVFFIPTHADAHSSGASFDKVVDGYFVDIGYSPAVPSVGELVSFDFSIKKGSADEEPVVFDDVWVRIQKGTQTFFAGGIANGSLGGPRMTLVFPEPGMYTVSARFENEGTEIVSTSFTLEVTGSEALAGSPEGILGPQPIGVTLIAFALGVLLTLGLGRLGLR